MWLLLLVVVVAGHAARLLVRLRRSVVAMLLALSQVPLRRPPRAYLVRETHSQIYRPAGRSSSRCWWWLQGEAV